MQGGMGGTRGASLHHDGNPPSPHKQLHDIRNCSTKALKEQRDKDGAVKHQSRLPSRSGAEAGQEVLSTGTYCNAGFH